MNRDTVGSAPRNGKTFEARIHKVNSSGNGVIETTSAPDIILGPVDRDAVGERIEAMKLPGPYARISRPKRILASNYINELQNLVSCDFSIDYGDAHGSIGKKGLDNHESGYGILEYVPPEEDEEREETEDLESAESKTASQADSSTSSSEHGESMDKLDSEKSKEVLAGEDSQYKYQTNSVIDSETNSIDPNTSTDTEEIKRDDSNLTDTSDVEENKETGESQNQHACDEDRQTTSADLNELRERAQDSANESVSKEVIATTAQPQYSRSAAIREYVMARADGICEGCGEPAPFTSKTGEPYLHAHHIHELSNGGSDTPDTVVGLCPNCHYRVHHGQDGDRYNDKLLKKVQNIEKNTESRQ